MKIFIDKFSLADVVIITQSLLNNSAAISFDDRVSLVACSFRIGLSLISYLLSLSIIGKSSEVTLGIKIMRLKLTVLHAHQLSSLDRQG